MKIESIYIENIGGISKLELDNLDPRLNIICGENGIGKTNILDCIANAFSFFQNQLLTVKQGNDSGKIKFFLDGKTYDKEIKTKSNNYVVDTSRNGFDLFSDTQKDYLLYIKTNRVFDYKKLSPFEPTTNPKTTNYKGISNDHLKSFFVMRSLHSGNANSGITEIEQFNFEVVKKAISLLDNSFFINIQQQTMK